MEITRKHLVGVAATFFLAQLALDSLEYLLLTYFQDRCRRIYPNLRYPKA